jgi:hypothetical protein
MEEKDRKILKTKKSSEDKVKAIHKQNTVSQHVNIVDGLDRMLITQAVKLKKNIDDVESRIKEDKKKYDALKKQIVAQIKGIEQSDGDSVEYNNYGIRIYKYPKNNEVGQVDEGKFETMARQKRIYGKVFKTVKVVDYDALVKAVDEELITIDELVEVLLTKNTPVIEMGYTNDNKSAGENEESDNISEVI